MSSSRKIDDQVAVLGQPLGVARPRHRQQPHAIRRRDRKAAEVLRLANRPDQDEDLALHAGARESGLQALGELGLADARKAGHVHRDARLQADGDQLNEVGELHVPRSALDTTDGKTGTPRAVTLSGGDS